MTTGFATYDHGHRLAPAEPATALDGTAVERLGMWPADAPAPWVLTVDEVALAIAHSGEEIGRYGLLTNEAADATVRGVRICGRGQLACAAQRLREGNELDAFPADAHPYRCQVAAQELCRKAHRDRPPL
ncbi:hypothetical protein [Amycolatopsis sp. DSM 110486]|uniref:hypothetical protein n=1 Tax=Amycolatopsis sp. DSM 110486 TaxID=2865832 RepID=UPI001C69C1B6|nr:hypothetical protein [Amycolatopsis sp. DSM 110486]QYN23743.1 hypothetical protein K1T34_15590 [Amycolatopsis sp. DSM 110486]